MQRQATQDVTYVPHSSTVGALVSYALLAGLMLALNWFVSGEPIPWRSPDPALGFLATAVLGFSPIVPLIQTGWSYLVTPEELVVSRFGHERFRLPLDSYVETTSPLGMLRLSFRFRSVYIMDPHSDARHAFAVLVRRRAEERLGGHASPAPDDGPLTRQTTVERVQPGTACVACGAPAEDTAPLAVQRGFDVVLWSHIHYSPVAVAVCAVHARRHRRWQRAVWLAYPLLSLVLGLAIWLSGEEVVLAGGLLLGTVGGVMLFRPVHSLWWGRFRDWQSLGVRCTRLAPDLQTATFRFRTPEVAARFEAS